MSSAKGYQRSRIILCVEDNPADALMVSELFKQVASDIELHFVEDGEAAMSFLQKTGKYLAAPRPDLIILDLNLPRMDGREVLKEIKQSSELCCIPTLVFTTSSSPEDIHRTYQLHANGFYTKPSDLDQFHQTIKAIVENWLWAVKLPDYPANHRVYI
jgi:CheY-like chemotaxis protein